MCIRRSILTVDTRLCFVFSLCMINDFNFYQFPELSNVPPPDPPESLRLPGLLSFYQRHHPTTIKTNNSCDQLEKYLRLILVVYQIQDRTWRRLIVSWHAIRSDGSGNKSDQYFRSKPQILNLALQYWFFVNINPPQFLRSSYVETHYHQCSRPVATEIAGQAGAARALVWPGLVLHIK